MLSAGVDGPTVNLMLGSLGSFAEFERPVIWGHQDEGITLAKKAGKYEAHPRALPDKKTAEAR